jgi:hypothetical protein
MRSTSATKSDADPEPRVPFSSQTSLGIVGSALPFALLGKDLLIHLREGVPSDARIMARAKVYEIVAKKVEDGSPSISISF